MWLVTGSSGYVGQHLLKDMFDQEIAAVALDVKPPLNRIPTHQYIAGNFADFQILNRILLEHNIEGIIHLAALKNATESNFDQNTYWKGNFADTVKLIESAKNLKYPKIIFASSAAVYGESIDKIQMIAKEDDLRLPKNIYGNTKLAVEKYLDYFTNQFSANAVSLRFFNIGGWGLDSRFAQIGQNLFPILHSKAKENLPLNVYGTSLPTKDGTQVRDYVHVSDVSRAILNSMCYLIEQREPDNLVINVGSGVGTTVLEIIDYYEKIADNKIKIDAQPYRPSDPIGLVADISKIKNLFYWAPLKSIKDIIESEISGSV